MISTWSFILFTWKYVLIFMVASFMFLLVFKLVKKIPSGIDFALTVAIFLGAILGVYLLALFIVMALNILSLIFNFVG